MPARYAECTLRGVQRSGGLCRPVHDADLREPDPELTCAKEVKMTHAQQILETHPRSAAMQSSALLECIEACFDCAQSCTACADACLGEDDVEMLIRCIRLCQDCSDVCTTTGRVLSRQTELDATVARAVVHACAEACRACGQECERHAGHHRHCRVCAEACRRCEQACEEALSALAA
jgi:hypothetical protein